MENMIGKMMGKYEVKRPLGKGGCGTVYLVEDSSIKKLYAMKTGERGLIMEEAERMKTISDRRFPYLVDVLEVDESDAAIIMEYIEGPTLEEYIRVHAPISEQETLAIMKQLAGILKYLHSLRPVIIYQDLKPSNLVLQSDGALRALDFGASLQGFGRIQSAYHYGTYGYSAPEQRREGAVTPACDVYAAGVIMYYMLTGIDPAKPPYGVAPLKEVSLTASAALGRIISGCCAEEPENRYADGSILLEHLNGVSTKREEIKDKLLLAAYYITLFAAAAYTGWSIYRIFSGVDNDMVPAVAGMAALYLIVYLMRRIIVEQHIRKHFIRKREWNLLYTEKRTIGLWTLVMLIFLITGCIKKENPERLPVYVSDATGRNILIRDGREYDVEGDLIFRLPTEQNGYYKIYFCKLNGYRQVEQEQIFLIR